MSSRRPPFPHVGDRLTFCDPSRESAVRRSPTPQARTVARLIAALALLSCGDGTGPVVPAAIVINPNHPSVPQGLTVQLTGTVVDAGGRAIRGLVPTFISENPLVATVTASGLVTAVGPVTSVTITAGYQGITTSVNLVVTQRAVSLSITPNPLVINRNAQALLSITALDLLGYPVSQVSLTSLDPAVATVSAFRVVTAGANPGTTEIEVSAGGLTVRVPVTVMIIPTSIDVQPRGLIVPPGGTGQLAAIVRDAVGAVIEGAKPTFTTTAPSVFSVSPAGLVTALGSSGSGTVRMSYATLVTDVGVFVGNVPDLAITTTQIGGGSYGAAVGPAGQVVVSRLGGNTALRGTLPETTFPTSVATGFAPLGVTINPAGTRAYVAVSQAITVIDLATNTTLPPITGLGGQVFDMRLSPDGQTIYAVAEGGVYRIDAGSQQVLNAVGAYVPLWVEVHPTLPKVYATSLGLQAVLELDATTLAELRRFNVGGSVQGLALRPGGAELFVANEYPPKLEVWDLATGVRTQQVDIVTGGFGVVVAGAFIVVTQSLGATVRVFDVGSRVLLATLAVGGTPRRPAVNPAGTTVVVPNEAGWVDFIE